MEPPPTGTTVSRARVLHTLRLTSIATVEVIAARLGADAEEVRAELVDAQRRGQVVERTGRLCGWSLTVEGRREGERLLAEELTHRDARGVVERSYAEFLTFNRRFLEVCTAWQLRPGPGGDVPNDHSDPDHDAQVLAGLEELHGRVISVVRDLASVLERFGQYAPRFEAALERVRQNDVDWFTKPLIDSYHTVWFELHEDLLATLGRTRAEEDRGE
jgi:hypothetical protein